MNKPGDISKEMVDFDDLDSCIPVVHAGAEEITEAAEVKAYAEAVVGFYN